MKRIVICLLGLGLLVGASGCEAKAQPPVFPQLYRPQAPLALELALYGDALPLGTIVGTGATNNNSTTAAPFCDGTHACALPGNPSTSRTLAGQVLLFSCTGSAGRVLGLSSNGGTVSNTPGNAGAGVPCNSGDIKIIALLDTDPALGWFAAGGNLEVWALR